MIWIIIFYHQSYVSYASKDELGLTLGVISVKGTHMMPTLYHNTGGCIVTLMSGCNYADLVIVLAVISLMINYKIILLKMWIVVHVFGSFHFMLLALLNFPCYFPFSCYSKASREFFLYLVGQNQFPLRNYLQQSTQFCKIFKFSLSFTSHFVYIVEAIFFL